MTLRRNDSTIRQYRPKVGQLIGMSEFSDYTSRGMSPWGRLRVIGIDQDTVTVKHAPSPMDPAKDDPGQCTIPLYVVQVPLGWEPRYTIHCKPDQAQTVINYWFKRGIVVRQSHDMGGNMPKAFQPLIDGVVPGNAHWQFPEDTDVIMPEDCQRLFRVVSVEEGEITSEVLGFPPAPDCVCCMGTGRRRIDQLAQARGEEWDVTLNLVEDGKIAVEDYQPHNRTFRCHCYWGAMKRMGRTKRGKLIKGMQAEGWEVVYRPYAGGFWERRRETVVHDWRTA